MSGGGVLSIQDMRITNEEVSPGAVPQWLLEHLISQLSDAKPYSDGGMSRILVIYPTTESRREIIELISNQGYVVDNTLHHTIPSLMDSIMSDFRMPQKLNQSSAFQIILHEECKKASANLGFPIINPLPEMNWSRGKTTALSELHAFLSSESLAKDWDGPGIEKFRKILQSLESKLNSTHDDFLPIRLIEKLINSERPFSLTDVDGIIMLNHSPTIPKSHIDFMKVISRHCPIHQLGNIGNIRLGEHGLRLIDEWAITDVSNLPEWVPKHNPTSQNKENNVDRIMLHRENQSFEATYSIVSNFLLESSNKTVLIIDPNFENNKNIWGRGMKNLGLPFSYGEHMLINNSFGHWINSYLNLSHSDDAFSLDKLRAISLQQSLVLFPEMPVHPKDERIRPIPDTELLTNIARSNHILGGPGALSQWLQSLSSNYDFRFNNDEDNIKKESTQWWLLCLSRWLNPLLSGFDRDSIKEFSNKGVFTNELLPLPDILKNGDDWFRSTINLLSEKMTSRSNVEDSVKSIAVIQLLYSEFSNLRSTQFLIKHNYPKMGPAWIDEMSNLIQKINIKISSSLSRNRVRILSCDQSLGCTADLTILANTSSNSWDLRVPKMHFIGDIERHENNLLRPDGPIRNARHNLEHILKSSPRVIILDSSFDDSNPPSTPIREWTISNNLDESKIFESVIDYSLSPRNAQRIDGLRLNDNQKSLRPPINSNSVTISIDPILQRDRERRQPQLASEDGYLPDENRNSVFNFDIKNMTRKTPKTFSSPRENVRWPVLSAITIDQNNSRKIKTQTIDPRPFTPRSLGINVNDSRNGFRQLENLNFPNWSPTRLQKWLRCPRSGWLTRSLKVELEDSQKEDLDARTHGDLFHKIHHNLILQTLNFKEKYPRNFDFDLVNNSPLNISHSKIDPQILMQQSLLNLDDIAPWLNRDDAVSTNRIRMMTGMSIREWDEWLSNPQPVPLTGRIGRMIKAELLLENVAPIAIEWDLSLYDKEGIEISLPSHITSPNGESLDSIKLKGQIDRVDLVPFDIDNNIWIDEEGSNEVAPLELYKSSWKPRRLVIIRDIKTSEKTDIKDRHFKGLLEELQLALYARSWEIANPGDLVIGAGISVLGHETSHLIEKSSNLLVSKLTNFGTETEITKSLFRFLDEDESPESDPFRAWMASRISVALNTSDRANKGFVNPIPQENNCKYCSVSNLCDVKLEGDF